jgi:hypothetical protein
MSRTFQLHFEELSDRVVPSVAPVDYPDHVGVVESVHGLPVTAADASCEGTAWSEGTPTGTGVAGWALPWVEESGEGQDGWSGYVPALPVVYTTVPIQYGRDGKEKVSSLAICETAEKDRVINAAYAYSKRVFDKTIEMPSGQDKWKDAIAMLSSIADGSLQQIVITGHGNLKKAGPFELDQIQDDKSQQAEFLKLLKQKAAPGATIELRACSTCSEDDQKLLKKMAELTGLTVIGYDDTYAIWPHGQQWIAKPGVKDVVKGEKYPAYKDSWTHYFESLVTGNKDKDKKKDKDKE